MEAVATAYVLHEMLMSAVNTARIWGRGLSGEGLLKPSGYACMPQDVTLSASFGQLSKNASFMLQDLIMANGGFSGSL